MVKRVENDKQKSVDSAITQIEKQFGKGSIMRLAGEDGSSVPVEVIPTGALALDVALGAGVASVRRESRDPLLGSVVSRSGVCRRFFACAFFRIFSGEFL